ncbi:hypothetical protein H0W26_05845 [Candidatus Dependentiae bacterium]|nr:hypothetical protein [Candidatus Dependentiae bacterium]
MKRYTRFFPYIFFLVFSSVIRSDEHTQDLPLPAKIDFFSSMKWDTKENRGPKKKYFLAKTKSARDKLDIYHTLKELYDTNYLPQKAAEGRNLIPKIVHQIWVGPHQPPAIFKESQKSIQKYLPDWEYKLWTDADIPTLDLYNKKFYDLSTNYGEKADILRYELLYKYGGVYLDVDIILLKPLDSLLPYDLWTTIMPLDLHGHLGNCVIGSIAGHPLLEHCIYTIKDDWYRFDHMPVNMAVVRKAGPLHFQKSFMQFVRTNPAHIVAFPSSYFCPSAFKTRRAALAYSSENTTQQIQSSISPETFAIHCWAGSWW